MKKTLLLVEDDTDFRATMANYISKHLSVNVLEAADGVEALSMLKTKPVHAILSDIRMPNMDGLEFFKSVRDMEVEAPVVFQTGYADKDTAIKALRLGAFDFIEKPYKLGDLVQTVHAALEKKVEKLKKRLERLSLTSNQVKIIEALLTGKSNKEIASELSITEQGVKYHVGSLLDRFEAKNRVELKQKIYTLIG